MDNNTIWVLEDSNGTVIETGTAREVTRAWLCDDGGDYKVEPVMEYAGDDENDEERLDENGEPLMVQETTLANGAGSKIWRIYIKDHINARFQKGGICFGETEEEALNDLLDRCFENINKSNFFCQSKESWEESQAELKAQAEADEINE